MFLDDKYLKYVGWTMYDRVSLLKAVDIKCEKCTIAFTLNFFSPKMKTF